LKNFYPVGSINDLRPGKGMKVKIKKRTIALFKHKNNIYAIQNNCPHQNADLADGYIKDEKVFCTLHHWGFELLTGAYSFNPKILLKTYEVKIENDIILVRIDSL
jgi:NAD(P)H-dependent nitrite reductase small subunit